MVDNFGSYLKHERELRGVPLEEIAGTTKIHISFLQALENNHFDQLPGEVFIKGYIRSYAKTIGFDVDEMLNAYDETVGRKRQEEVQTTKAEKERVEQGKKQIYQWVLWAVVAVMAGGGILFLVDNWPGTHNRGSAAVPPVHTPPGEPVPATNPEGEVSALSPMEALPSAEGTAPAAPEPVSEPTEMDTSLAKENPASAPVTAEVPGKTSPPGVPTSSPAEPSAKPAAAIVMLDSGQEDPEAEKPYKLVIKVTENSWFNLTVDGNREEDFILPSGTGKTFFANRSFRITIGNRKGTTINLNGKPVSLPAANDNVVRDFIINPESSEG